ncbi:winged helix-turn-helix domain-containing protein [Bowmanella yangjiangensis]|uniref:Winged helix-turn-helix domain-containing protein n=1 Tax=Bowmanella yangjiangensis TaxID=2811230 RepID=A0ABS3CTN7_9ALTE|nr:winged helix-turn-helix domain-containing protein [Bowmanella yangjiangensis]MBN7819655.1 winged helix-turn-helix domain-containing protein [Bowmanella yangjiangensis]
MGEWQVCPTQNSLTRGNETRQLEHTPMQLLLFLAQHANQTLSKEQLLAHIWTGKVVSEEVLTVAISNIRKALGDSARTPKYIKTLPGKGYCLICPPTALPSANTPVEKKRPLWHFAPLLLLVPLLWWFWPNMAQLTVAGAVPSSAGQDLYNQGRFLLFSQEDNHLLRADSLFDQALQQDPQLGSALWGKAMVLLLKAENTSLEQAAPLRNQAMQLLEEAEQRESDNAAVQLQLGWQYFTHQRDFRLARQKFERAIELDGRDPIQHFLYAQFLMAMGENDAALLATRRYIDLAPQYYAVPVVAWIYNTARQPQQALSELEKIAALTEPDLSFHHSAIKILENLGQDQRAFHHVLQSMQLSGFTAEQISQTRAQFTAGGLTQVYAWFIEQKISDNLGHYAAPLAYARYAIKANQPEQAIKWLQQAQQARQIELLWMAVDPYYDPLRLHPDFHLILNQLGLKPPSQ